MTVVVVDAAAFRVRPTHTRNSAYNDCFGCHPLTLFSLSVRSTVYSTKHPSNATCTLSDALILIWELMRCVASRRIAVRSYTSKVLCVLL